MAGGSFETVHLLSSMFASAYLLLTLPSDTGTQGRRGPASRRRLKLMTLQMYRLSIADNSTGRWLFTPSSQQHLENVEVAMVMVMVVVGEVSSKHFTPCKGWIPEVVLHGVTAILNSWCVIIDACVRWSFIAWHSLYGWQVISGLTAAQGLHPKT